MRARLRRVKPGVLPSLFPIPTGRLTLASMPIHAFFVQERPDGL